MHTCQYGDAGFRLKLGVVETGEEDHTRWEHVRMSKVCLDMRV